MKKVLLAVCGLWLCGGAVQAQNYSIDWFTIDGGGGTSTGGVFKVTGTIGQADAGHMSGGNFTLDGGFWAIIAVQTPGAPALRVVRTTTNTVVLAWPNPSTGFSLQENSVVNNSPGWASVTNTPPVVVGSERQVIIPSPVGNRFYRLKSP